MSLIRTGIILAAVVMLLPSEEKKQVEFASTAALTAQQTASFCDRNPSTCATGRDAWALFLRKAEYGMELGSRLLREQLVRGMSGDSTPVTPPQLPAHMMTPPAQHVRVEPLPPATAPRPEPAARRSAYQMDNAPRWRQP